MVEPEVCVVAFLDGSRESGCEAQDPRGHEEVGQGGHITGRGGTRAAVVPSREQPTVFAS